MIYTLFPELVWGEPHSIMHDFLCDRALPQPGFLLLISARCPSLAREASFLDYTISGEETGWELDWVQQERDRHCRVLSYIQTYFLHTLA